MKKLLMILLLITALSFAVSRANAAPAYSVKDGLVYAGETKIDAELNEVPAELKNGIKYWAFIEEDDDPYEKGVWFFTEDGQLNGFISLEIACQDLIWSPDGGQFLLVTGSGIRPDVFFALYGEGMEKKVEFPGMLGAAAWIDPRRFVLTRIDDVRSNDDGVILGYAGLKTSIILYDSAAKRETVLKEASDTLNYSLNEVGEEDISVEEAYVASPKDWGDEDKIETREVTIEIPPAG